MVGTSAAMRMAYRGQPPAKLPDGLWCYRIDREQVIVGGALSDGGNLYNLIKTRFELPANVDEIIAERGSANDELIVLPFFFGERSTGYDEKARGAIIGLTHQHDGVDVLRAAMEGVAFRLADVLDRLQKVARIDEIVASGGALRDSPVWAQMIANVLGRDLTVTAAAESSSKGAVLLALETVGKIGKK
jgi:gluconokinase